MQNSGIAEIGTRVIKGIYSTVSLLKTYFDVFCQTQSSKCIVLQPSNTLPVAVRYVPTHHTATGNILNCCGQLGERKHKVHKKTIGSSNLTGINQLSRTAQNIHRSDIYR